MEKKIEQKFNEWLNSSALSKEEKDELEALKGNEKELTERFIADLEFGTAGLRGVMAMGTNRMNRHVIRHATQGLANFLLLKEKKPSVAIAYDSRLNSNLFAREAARVLAANGIKVYIYEHLMPVPALSYAVRQLKTSAGIVVTASHNPKQYNGYKVYGPDGCQMTTNNANAVLAEINKIGMFDVKLLEFENNLQISYISNDLIEKYYASVLSQSIEGPEDSKRILKVTYTPLHGAGFIPVTTVLKRDGFEHIDIVEEQKDPDGDFTTCPYPNPEIKEAMDLGMKLMIKNGNDVLVATDPDSDRAGVAVNQNGEAVILTGNEIGILLFDFIYHARVKQNKLPKNPIVVKSIVSSSLVNLMGEKFGVKVIDVLTGFKWIGEQLLLLEEKHEEYRYIFGFEESYGYLTNPEVRDKDAVNAVLLIAEMANYYKHQGLTLLDRLNELYKEFGPYKTKTIAYEYPGLEGQSKMKEIMKKLRAESFSLFDKVVSVGDFQTSVEKYLDREEKIILPKSDVLRFTLPQHETIIFRPSGTEPKLKAYIFAQEEHIQALQNKLDKILK